MRQYMISLKDRHFQNIKKGSKTLEFRKKFANEDSPFLCYIYIPRPKQEIIGKIVFDKPYKSTIENVLSYAKREEYENLENVAEYFKGKEEGFALKALKVMEFDRPIGIDLLNSRLGNFYPPQSYYCLDRKHFKELREFLYSYDS